MRRPRLTIAAMLALIAMAALALAAIRSPSSLWASITFSLMVISLTVAFLGVVYRRGPKRAFWVGFLTCGGLYLVLSQAPWFESHVSHRLFTTALLDFLYPRVPSLKDQSKFPNDPWKLWNGSPPDFSFAHPRLGFTTSSTDEYHNKTRAQFYVNTTDEFLLIGHSLFGMLAGLGGGFLARYFLGERESAQP